jgi:Family of unknown function (DUF6152)
VRYTKASSTAAALAGILFLACSAASAHHATAAQYDVSTTVLLKGVITRAEWVNPHMRVYIDVKNESGNSDVWTVEFPSPGAAVVAGLSRQLLAVGTTLTVEVYPAKSPTDHAVPSRSACAKAMNLSDGTHFKFVVGI